MKLDGKTHATETPGNVRPMEATGAYDLARNWPGQSAQAQADKILATVHPFKRLLHRLFGMNVAGESWRLGAVGERLVGAEITRLGPEWRSLHAIPVGVRGSDIDHLLIGPGGVFTVNTKNHSRSRVWCGERMVMVNGRKTHYVRNSIHEAGRAARILSAACGDSIQVSGLLAFIVPPQKLTIKRPKGPIPVTFLYYQQLRRWGRGLPPVLTPQQVEAIYEVARVSTIWTVPHQFGAELSLPARDSGARTPTRAIEEMTWG